MLKSIHLFPFALLAYFAWLQLNDPDPVFWVCLYSLAALAPLMHFLNKPTHAIRKYILGIAAGFCLAGVVLVLEGAAGYLDHIGEESLIQDMSPDKPYIEETREFLGALIALGIVAIYSWLPCRKLD
jgi:hypothetical protein